MFYNVLTTLPASTAEASEQVKVKEINVIGQLISGELVLVGK